LNGIEALKLIKEISPTTEVLIVTANSGIESAKKAVKFGAYDYLDKPFKKEDLRATIRRGVEKRRKAQAAEKAKEKLAFVKAQLRLSEKFSALGELVAGVAHELNNPLGAILGFSEVLLMKEFPPEKTKKYLENIHNSAQLCGSIIEKLLTFSRKREKKREYTDVNAILQTTIELKQHDFKMDSIQVDQSLAEQMPFTMVDVHELQQVFLNMINNAHQAMKMYAGEGTLTLESLCIDKKIRITIRDTGPGIPEENLQKIFEPLFTTKPEGQGTGLGLSVCYDIISEHGGDIFIASESGKGACFMIELPVLKPNDSEA
jgi:two-component system NtrC family sensor kinase